ncbi:MAG: short-chain dehydrogenase, partial [Calditrichia bacterium]
YVLSFTQALYSELKDSGISVTTLCPGPTRSNFQQRSGLDKADAKLLKLGFMSAEKVARLGYKGMMKGKRLVIPGFMNKMSAAAGRVFPNRILLPVVKLLHK